MKRFLTGMMLATALASGAAFADDAAEMGEGLSMLETAASKELARIGITGVDPMSLTLSQLAEIKGVVGSSESNTADMEQQVRKILARN